MEAVLEIPPELKSLAEIARKYDSAEDFVRDKDYILYPFYHITENPNFKVSKDYVPKDLSTSASELIKGEPGLMATQDLDYWVSMMKKEGLSPRAYAVKLDLKELTPRVDYKFVDRGFGNEIWIKKEALDKVKIVKQTSVASAIRESEKYKAVLERTIKSKEDLIDFYNKVVKMQENIRFDHSKEMTESYYGLIDGDELMDLETGKIGKVVVLPKNYPIVKFSDGDYIELKSHYRNYGLEKIKTKQKPALVKRENKEGGIREIQKLIEEIERSLKIIRATVGK